MMKSRHQLICLLMLLTGFLPLSRGEIVTIPVTADTTLHEFAPDNNVGAHIHVAAGATGPNGSMKRARGLLHFNLAGQVPSGAVINSAVLTINMIFEPFGGPDSTFGVHRMLKGWNEGLQSGNTGSAAVDGEVTWNSRVFPATPWGAPGGAAGVDFQQQASASVAVSTPTAYKFGPSPSLLADVQSWIQNPDTNFGWILISELENVGKTAKRFGSREGGSPAILEINYTLPVIEPILLSAAHAGATNILLSWTGGKAPFEVQRKSTLDQSAWSRETVTSANSVSIPTIGAAAVFRVSSGP